MVEQVRISPEEVRGYGNICEGHTLEDFIVSNSGLAKEKENVHGALTDVYKLVYSLYGFMFDFDKGNKQLYLQTAEADILSFGFDTVNKQLYLVDEDDTGFNLGFDTDTRELYITDEAPPSISISASSPYLLSGETTDLIVTLYDGVGAPLTNKSVTISDGTSVYTGITDNNGTYTKTGVSVSGNTTFTATYLNVSDSVTVEHCVWVDYGVATKHIDHYYYNSNNGSVRVTDTGTKLQNSTGNFDVNMIPLDQTVSSSNIYKWNAPLIIEFDIVESTATNGEALVQVYSQTTNNQCTQWIGSDIGHWKVEVNSDNTQNVYCNGTLKKSTSLTLTNSRIILRTTNLKYLTYKNFRIREG